LNSLERIEGGKAMNLKKLVSISFFMQCFYIKKLVSVICVVVVLVFFQQ